MSIRRAERGRRRERLLLYLLYFSSLNLHIQDNIILLSLRSRPIHATSCQLSAVLSADADSDLVLEKWLGCPSHACAVAPLCN